MFSEAKEFIVNAISANEDLNTITLLDSVTSGYDDAIQNALRTSGLALVVTPTLGIRGESKPIASIEHHLMVSIIENTLKNETGNGALDIAEKVILAVDAAALSMKSRKLKFRSGDPAYELGSTEANPVVVFCNFKYRTFS